MTTPKGWNSSRVLKLMETMKIRVERTHIHALSKIWPSSHHVPRVIIIILVQLKIQRVAIAFFLGVRQIIECI